MYTILTIIAGVYDHMIRMVLQNVYFFPPAVHSLQSYTFFLSILIYKIWTVLSTLFSNRIESKCDTEKEYKFYIVIKVLLYNINYFD